MATPVSFVDLGAQWRSIGDEVRAAMDDVHQRTSYILGPQLKRFEEDFHTPAIYYLQLLAFAQGVPYDELGLERQRFKVECLRRFEVSDDGDPASA